jgi:hypothetical protein
MAMQIENTTKGKIIGVGDVTVLPGEIKDIPGDYENNPVLDIYVKKGFARISGGAKAIEKSNEEIAVEKASAEAQAKADAEALRQARLAALSGISEEDLGKMALELGINPADCKDQADVLKKVKAALKK